MPLSPRWNQAALIAGLLLVTSAHIAWRFAPEKKAVYSLSKLPAGSIVPQIDLKRIGAGPATAASLPTRGCRVLVVFSSTCPHCHSALRRARSAERGERPPVVWIAALRDLGAASVVKELGVGDHFAQSADAWNQLQVTAVPAAFLIGDDERIRNVWVYQGDEDPALLRVRCTEPVAA